MQRALPVDETQLDATSAFGLSSANDTSLALDLLRAISAQAVCVGHIVNYRFGQPATPTTYAAQIGVMGFFLLSGFLIAHTLASKSSDPRSGLRYGIGAFAIERTARIYTAYLPALVLIMIVDAIMTAAGHRLPATTSDSAQVFLKNVLMLEGHPIHHLAAPTYGSAGQLTSVAVEFHIYFFVGGLYFVLLGRNRLAALAAALLGAPMALSYFASAPESHALFALWLMGFAAYFICRAARIDRALAIGSAVAAAGLTAYWFAVRVPGQDYELTNYPVLALAFLGLAIATQRSDVLVRSPWLARAIRFAADYSFSLFLVHLTLVKALFVLIEANPDLASRISPNLKVALGIAVANAAAIGFALLFERHYKWVAVRAKEKLLGTKRSTENSIRTSTAMPPHQLAPSM
jgi:peptidoglycan/LPS O-acetylase OafA/YrhL